MERLVSNASGDLDVYLRCFYKGSRHVVSLYNRAPQLGEISLRNFQEVAAKRLALLQYIDARSDVRLKAAARDGDARHGGDKNLAVEEKMQEFGFILPRVIFTRQEALEHIHVAQADVISHFILRLAFARDPNKRDWFIKNELRLFEIRMERLKAVKIQEVDGQPKLESFFANNGVVYEAISLPASAQGTRSGNAQVQSFYDLIRFRSDAVKVDKIYIMPFYPDAISLVRNRQVLVKDSVAYVPNTALHIVASSRFRYELYESWRFLDQNRRILEEGVLQDERISAFLKALPESYLAVDFSQMGLASGSKDDCKLSLTNINKIFKSTFPPCMRRLFEALVKNGHLKHYGRQQLWLFLKGCGMSMDETIYLNRTLWADASNFDKEHNYNIRHMYGREGRRANYPPYTCSKIINQLPPPAAGHFHGCPFKELSSASLIVMLKEHGLNEDQILAIMDYKDSHQYQVACIEYFTQTSPPGANADEIGLHPNVFFQARYKAHFIAKENNGASAR